MYRTVSSQSWALSMLLNVPNHSELRIPSIFKPTWSLSRTSAVIFCFPHLSLCICSSGGWRSCCSLTNKLAEPFHVALKIIDFLCSHFAFWGVEGWNKVFQALYNEADWQCDAQPFCTSFRRLLRFGPIDLIDS